MSEESTHSSVVDVPRRRITREEEGWISEIVSASPEWATVGLDDLFVVGECTCGCRTVALATPDQVQNPELAECQGLVGSIDICIRFDAREDVVSVNLHHAEGNLTFLEVVWYNFPEPVPRQWTEISRHLTVGNP